MRRNLSTIGLLQALGVAAYCALVGWFLWGVSGYLPAPPGFLGIVLMLILLVFSAAVSGSIVFGYPAYLALNNKIKDGLIILSYTLLYCLAVIIVAVVVLSILG